MSALIPIMLPLARVDCELLDSAGASVALIRGNMEEYRRYGDIIVAAVNAYAPFSEPLVDADVNVNKTLVELVAGIMRLRKSHDDLLAAAKKVARFEYDWPGLKAAIANAEKATP